MHLKDTMIRCDVIKWHLKFTNMQDNAVNKTIKNGKVYKITTWMMTVHYVWLSWLSGKLIKLWNCTACSINVQRSHAIPISNHRCSGTESYTLLVFISCWPTTNQSHFICHDKYSWRHVNWWQCAVAMQQAQKLMSLLFLHRVIHSALVHQLLIIQRHATWYDTCSWRHVMLWKRAVVV